MNEAHQISKQKLIENKIGFCMFDLDTAKSVVIDCTEDLKIESLCHSDGELDNDGHNLLVKINNSEYKDAYMFMASVDYQDFEEDFYGQSSRQIKNSPDHYETHSRDYVEKLVIGFINKNQILAQYGKDSEGIFQVDYIVKEGNNE